jgi:hypothetical protein
MIHLNLHFSHWWLLLPLAIMLLFIIGKQDFGGGIGGGFMACFVMLICLAVFLIVLACMVGYSLGNHG